MLSVTDRQTHTDKTTHQLTNIARVDMRGKLYEALQEYCLKKNHMTTYWHMVRNS